MVRGCLELSDAFYHRFAERLCDGEGRIQCQSWYAIPHQCKDNIATADRYPEPVEIKRLFFGENRNCSRGLVYGDSNFLLLAFFRHNDRVNLCF